MPRPKLKTISTIKPKGFTMNPGSKNIDSPGVFSLNNTNTISSLNPDTDPKLTKKEGKAETSVSTSGDTTTTTTIQRVSGTGKKGGFVSGTSYDLDEVIVGLDTNSSSSTKQKPKSRRKNPSLKRKTYSKAGNFLRGINPLSTKHERVRARTRLGQDTLL